MVRVCSAVCRCTGTRRTAKVVSSSWLAGHGEHLPVAVSGGTEG
jgi:hypothetical protein